MYARRMIFVGNSNLIQSEARLRPCKPTAPSPLTKRGSKKRQSQPPTSDIPEMKIDPLVLGMYYHNLIIAGIASSK